LHLAKAKPSAIYAFGAKNYTLYIFRKKGGIIIKHGLKIILPLLLNVSGSELDICTCNVLYRFLYTAERVET
jgi:hypothetical protein